MICIFLHYYGLNDANREEDLAVLFLFVGVGGRGVDKNVYGRRENITKVQKG